MVEVPPAKTALAAADALRKEPCALKHAEGSCFLVLPGLDSQKCLTCRETANPASSVGVGVLRGLETLPGLRNPSGR